MRAVDEHFPGTKVAGSWDRRANPDLARARRRASWRRVVRRLQRPWAAGRRRFRTSSMPSSHTVIWLLLASVGVY